MFKGLKNFLEGPSEGIKNISGLGNYIKEKWGKLIIFIIVLILVIGVVIKILKMLISLLRGR